MHGTKCIVLPTNRSVTSEAPEGASDRAEGLAPHEAFKNTKNQWVPQKGRYLARNKGNRTLRGTPMVISLYGQGG